MKYMLALVGPEGDDDQQMSADDLSAAMVAWNEFNRELIEAGAFVAGDALQRSSSATTVRHDGSERVVTDGPFAETKEQLGGYYVIDCAGLDDALEWAKKVPIRDGNSVEVRPVWNIEEFGYVDPYAATAGAAR